MGCCASNSPFFLPVSSPGRNGLSPSGQDFCLIALPFARAFVKMTPDRFPLSIQAWFPQGYKRGSRISAGPNIRKTESQEHFAAHGCPSAGWMKRESGQNPERCRHCVRELSPQESLGDREEGGSDERSQETCPCVKRRICGTQIVVFQVLILFRPGRAGCGAYTPHRTDGRLGDRFFIVGCRWIGGLRGTKYTRK